MTLYLTILLYHKNYRIIIIKLEHLLDIKNNDKEKHYYKVNFTLFLTTYS